MYVRKDKNMFTTPVKHDYLGLDLDEDLGPNNKTFLDLVTLHLGQASQLKHD